MNTADGKPTTTVSIKAKKHYPESQKTTARNLALRQITRHRICSNLRSLEAIVANRGTLMWTISHFETLTMRHVLIQGRTKKLISDLQDLIQLLDGNIYLAEKQTPNSGIPNSDRFASARKLKARRDNLVATISGLNEGRSQRDLHS